MTRVAVIDGCRTPFTKMGSALAQYSLLDLGMHAVSSLVQRLDIDPVAIEELAYGAVMYDTRLPNLAREIVQRTDLPNTVGAHFVSNNCITGLVAVNMISEAIQSGRVAVGLAGGVESLSRPSLSVHPKGEEFFIRLSRARSLGEKLPLLSKFRLKYLMPQAPSPKEPSTGLTMGQHMELTAQEMKIARELQDNIALRSHQNAARAASDGILGKEIAPLGGVEQDNLIRSDTSLEKLAKLRPVFERSEKGTLTAGNSSPLTDGASAVCLMSEQAAKTHGKEILAYIEDVRFAAISADDGLLMAPCVALPKLMQANKLTIDDVDFFEVHEAFGAQVAANMQVWENGWDKPYDMQPIGRIPEEKLNVLGGSIAIGHPFAATGGRLITTAANALKREDKKRAVISVCAAGAMAAAVSLVRD